MSWRKFRPPEAHRKNLTPKLKYEFDNHVMTWLIVVMALETPWGLWVRALYHDGACCYRLPGPARILNVLSGLFLCRD